MKSNNTNVSVCIDMMFSHLDFYDRIKAVRRLGINTVEFWKWSNKDVERVANGLKGHGMRLSVFNIDSSDAKLSYDLSRGILNSGRKEELLSALKESAPIYKKLGASGMIILVGETVEGMSRVEQTENVFDCLEYVRDFVEQEGITLVVEPLNATDRQNYFMPEAGVLMEILHRVNSPNIKMLYDIYHQHMTGDFDLEFVKENIEFIGHFHVADCPGRHEPGTGKVDYVRIIREILGTGYGRYIGLEYRATKNDEETLGFLAEVKNA